MWIGIILVVGALLVLLLGGDSGTRFGMSQEDFAPLVYSLALLIFIGGGFLGSYKGRFSSALRDIALWLSIVLMIAIGYSYRFELKNVWNRVQGNIFTSSPRSISGMEHLYSVNRSSSGHYEIKIFTNGTELHYLIDTGASNVVLTAQSARQLGYDPDNLDYTRIVSTANGLTRAAPLRIQEMRIGDMEIYDVSALVSKPSDLDENLLGMSFLNKLKSYRVENEQFILEGY